VTEQYVPDTEPDPGEVLQHEAAPLHVAPIPVVVEGPTRIQSLPAIRQWAMAQLTIDQNNPQQLAQADPRRSKLTIVAQTTPIFIGDSSGAVVGNRRFRLPIDRPESMGHGGEVWAVGDAGTAVVYVYMEYWTD
jgi:hypothetical protein